MTISKTVLFAASLFTSSAFLWAEDSVAISEMEKQDSEETTQSVSATDSATDSEENDELVEKNDDEEVDRLLERGSVFNSKTIKRPWGGG